MREALHKSTGGNKSTGGHMSTGGMEVIPLVV